MIVKYLEVSSVYLNREQIQLTGKTLGGEFRKSGLLPYTLVCDSGIAGTFDA